MKKYLFIANDLKNNIKLGIYKHVMRLPKEDELMKTYSVSRITVRSAIAHLRNEGLIKSKAGVGSLIIENNSNYSNEKKHIVLILENTAPGLIRLLEGAEYVLAKNGYRLSLKISNENPEEEKRLCNESLNNKSTGIIVFPTDEVSNAPLYQKMIYNNYPLVFLDRCIQEQPCNCVSTNNFLGIQMMTEYLIANGHSKIAYINCGNLIPLRERLQSFLNTMLEYNLNIPSTYIISYRSEFSPLAIKPIDFLNKLSQLMSEEQRPTAIICCNDYVAAAATQHLTTLGFKIPDDISITGYDNIFKDIAHLTTLTTIEQDFFKIGEIAAKLIIDTLNKSHTYSKIFIKPTFIEGKSVKNILPR